MILYSIFYFLANKQKIVTNFQKIGLNQKINQLNVIQISFYGVAISKFPEKNKNDFKYSYFGKLT